MHLIGRVRPGGERGEALQRGPLGPGVRYGVKSKRLRRTQTPPLPHYFSKVLGRLAVGVTPVCSHLLCPALCPGRLTSAGFPNRGGRGDTGAGGGWGTSALPRLPQRCILGNGWCPLQSTAPAPLCSSPDTGLCDSSSAPSSLGGLAVARPRGSIQGRSVFKLKCCT